MSVLDNLMTKMSEMQADVSGKMSALQADMSALRKEVSEVREELRDSIREVNARMDKAENTSSFLQTQLSALQFNQGSQSSGAPVFGFNPYARRMILGDSVSHSSVVASMGPRRRRPD